MPFPDEVLVDGWDLDDEIFRAVGDTLATQS
jgi:hypothetical protein